MGAVVVYFFACESQNRTLEEIDTMYILGANPIKSKYWQPPEGEDLPGLDNARTSRLVLEVLGRTKPACLEKRDARVRGRRVAVFSKLSGRNSRVVIEPLNATTFTVHAEVAGSVAFFGVHRGSVITGYSVYTSGSAGEFSLGHYIRAGL